MSERRIIDISAPVSNASPSWPGDTAFDARMTWRIADGDSCNVSRIITSPHNGTHSDAPLHFVEGGPGIDEVPLESYVGPCVVVDGPRSGQIEVEHLRGVDFARTPRILVKTYDTHPEAFDRDFVSVSVAAAEFLVQRKARLIGLDSASMDPFDSREAAAHKVLLPGGIALLENLVLDHVEAGEYELIALPLRWIGLDASPVRAVLRTLE